jgi:hypothetical protein
MYVNGQPTDYVITTGSTAGYNANNRLYLGGTFGVTSSFYTGSMASFFSYNTDVPNTQLVQNYNAYATRFGLRPSILFPSSVDPDAFRFLEVANIIDQTQITAVNNLVAGLKANSLWDKMQAIYPFVGGSAFSHKWNLKNPADVDSAFRILFFGAVTHNNLGVSASAAGYGDTNFRPLSNFTNISSSLHASIYMSAGLANGSIFTDFTTQWNSSNRTLDISPVRIPGEINSTNVFAAISAYSTTGASNIIQTNAAGATTGLNRTGLWAATRTSDTLATAYRRSSVQNFTITSTNAFVSPSQNNTMRLFRSYTDNGAPSGGLFTFASLGQGLTTLEIDTLYTLVQTYQTTLGRQA